MLNNNVLSGAHILYTVLHHTNLTVGSGHTDGGHSRLNKYYFVCQQIKLLLRLVPLAFLHVVTSCPAYKPLDLCIEVAGLIGIFCHFFLLQFIPVLL